MPTFKGTSAGTRAARDAVVAVDRIYERAQGRGDDAEPARRVLVAAFTALQEAEFSELGFRTEQARALAAATARDLNESLLATEWAVQKSRRR